MYRLLKDVREEEQAAAEAASRKTYWDKYPDLKLLRAVPKPRCALFLFTCYWFLFCTGEYSGIFAFGYRWLYAQNVMTGFIISAGMFFEYSMRKLKVMMLIPMMSIVMAALSCYVCLLALIVFSFATIRPYDYFGLFFHTFLFTVTILTTVVLGKATDYLWQGFFTMIDLGSKEGMLDKLRNNELVVEENSAGRRNKKTKNGQGASTGRK